MTGPSSETEIALLKASNDQLVKRLSAAEAMLKVHDDKMRHAESWGRGVFWASAAAFAVAADIGRVRTMIKGFLGL